MMTHNIAFCRYIVQEDDVPEEDRLYAESVLRAWDETKEVYSHAPLGPLPTDVDRELARAKVLRDRDHK
jgi:hypothetical protein